MKPVSVTDDGRMRVWHGTEHIQREMEENYVKKRGEDENEVMRVKFTQKQQNRRKYLQSVSSYPCTSKYKFYTL